MARQLDRSMPLLLLLLVSVYIPQNVFLFLLAQAQPLQRLAGAAVRADKLCAVPRDRQETEKILSFLKFLLDFLSSINYNEFVELRK